MEIGRLIGVVWQESGAKEALETLFSASLEVPDGVCGTHVQDSATAVRDWQSIIGDHLPEFLLKTYQEELHYCAQHGFKEPRYPFFVKNTLSNATLRK